MVDFKKLLDESKEFDDLKYELIHEYTIWSCYICDDEDYDDQYLLLKHIEDNHTLKELRDYCN